MISAPRARDFDSKSFKMRQCCCAGETRTTLGSVTQPATTEAASSVLIGSDSYRRDVEIRRKARIVIQDNPTTSLLEKGSLKPRSCPCVLRCNAIVGVDQKVRIEDDHL